MFAQLMVGDAAPASLPPSSCLLRALRDSVVNPPLAYSVVDYNRSLARSCQTGFEVGQAVFDPHAALLERVAVADRDCAVVE